MYSRLPLALAAVSHPSAALAAVRSRARFPSAPSRAAAPLTVGSDQFECSIVTTPSQLERVADGWRELCGICGTPVEQFDWVQACAEILKDSGDLRTVVLLQGDGLRAAAPLAVRPVRGLRRRVSPGVEELGEPMGFLARDPADFAPLARALARDPLPLLCGRFPLDSAAITALQRAYRGRGIVLLRPQPAAPYITLSREWLEPELRLNSGRRSDLRRARRRAEELGRVVAEVLTPPPESLSRLLDEALEVERKSWKGVEGTAVAGDAVHCEFFHRVASAACRSGALRLGFLRINGRAVAAQIAVVHNRRYWLLKVGYDPEFARCSPGLLLIRETIAAAVAEGLEGYEFLGREEPWITAWTAERHEYVSVRAYPFSVQGAAAFAVDASCRAFREAARVTRSTAAAARRSVRPVLAAVVHRAARGYISGPSLADAQRVRATLSQQGLAATIGYWDADGEDPQQVAREYHAGIELLSEQGDGDYLSIKLPSLGGDRRLIDDVVRHAAEARCRLHLDALGPEHADATLAALERLRGDFPDVRLSHTLPGRWRRSVADAEWVVERGIAVRVVKGQWADPADPDRDLRAGYLEVIDRLAGRAAMVQVATHDVPLAREALARLRAAGTPCTLELLYGLPVRPALGLARELPLPVRVYVPYGAAYLPYAVSRLRRNPRILYWLARDAVAALFRWG